jgi:hypothetical protein
MKKPIIDMKLIKAAASRTAFGNISAPLLPTTATPRKEKANRTREKSLNFRVSTAIFEETRNAAATLRITQVEFIEQAIRERLEKVKAERKAIGADWVAARPARNTRS